MSFSTLINNAILPMADSLRPTVAEAFTDFQEAIDLEMIACGLGAPERSRFQDQLAALGRGLAVSMRPGTNSLGSALLTESQIVLCTENGADLRTET